MLPIHRRGNIFSAAMLNSVDNGAFSTTNSMIYCEFYNFYCEFYKKLVWYENMPYLCIGQTKMMSSRNYRLIIKLTF